MNNPLDISDSCKKIVGAYPKHEILCNCFTSMNDEEIEGFVSLWMSEGIPFAFKENPYLYEQLRQWIAKENSVLASEVTLVGSARLGYSLSPNRKGKNFSKESDLDLLIISEKLFLLLSNEASLWAKKYEEGEEQPNSDREKKFWDGNIKVNKKNIEYGFIDSNKIPNHDSYPTTRKLNNTAFLVKIYLDNLRYFKGIKSSSFRVYNNKKSFLYQNIKNIRDVYKYKVRIIKKDVKGRHDL